MEVMWVMKTKVFWAEFPVVGWNNYSDTPGTVCSMILEDVSFLISCWGYCGREESDLQ
jgi:hypothetical protein